MGHKRNKKSTYLGRKTFIHELISKAEKEQSNSQRDARKTRPHRAITPIIRIEAFDSSVSRPYHTRTSITTPKTNYPNQEQQWKASAQDVQNNGQGEASGEHQETGVGKYSLTY